MMFFNRLDFDNMFLNSLGDIINLKDLLIIFSPTLLDRFNLNLFFPISIIPSIRMITDPMLTRSRLRISCNMFIVVVMAIGIWVVS